MEGEMLNSAHTPACHIQHITTLTEKLLGGKKSLNAIFTLFQTTFKSSFLPKQLHYGGVGGGVDFTISDKDEVFVPSCLVLHDH